MNIDELTKNLEEFKRQGKYVDVRVCPHCKSTRLTRIGSVQGDTSGHMSMTLPKFECLDCGWKGRLTIYATNRPISGKQIDTVSKALEHDDERNDESTQ